jgi:hypothetical protein
MILIELAFAYIDEIYNEAVLEIKGNKWKFIWVWT